MKKSTLSFLSILMIVLSACLQEKPKNQGEIVLDGWKTLEGSDYSIQYPDSFVVDKSGQAGMSFMLLSKQTSSKDLFRENVNLLIQNLAGQNIDLDRYTEISEDQILTMLTDSKIIENKRVNDGDQQYHKFIYTGKQGDLNFKWLQHYWIKNEKAYILTLTCIDNQYDNYVEIGNKIISTFKIK